MPYKDSQKKKEYYRMYREKNREKINARRRIWSKDEKQKEKKREYARNYEQEYRKKPRRKKYLKEFFKDYYKKRVAVDEHYKLRLQISHRIYMALKRKGICKSKKTMKLLGCTVEQLWKHLEYKFKSGMTRENYGQWHVDHIKPCAAFDLTKPEEQQKCFHYTNLQPLWAKDNLKKGKRYEHKLQS